MFNPMQYINYQNTNRWKIKEWFYLSEVKNCFQWTLIKNKSCFFCLNLYQSAQEYSFKKNSWHMSYSKETLALKSINCKQSVKYVSFYPRIFLLIVKDIAKIKFDVLRSMYGPCCNRFYANEIGARFPAPREIVHLKHSMKRSSAQQFSTQMICTRVEQLNE